MTNETPFSTRAHIKRTDTLGVKSATPWTMRVRRPIIWTHEVIAAHPVPTKTVIVGTNDDDSTNEGGDQTPLSPYVKLAA